jgi:putative transposase
VSASALVLSAPQPNPLVVPCNTSSDKTLRRPLKITQFTSEDWTAPLLAAGVAISMDGKGRWIDNVFIERLWRSVKYEEVYLRAYANGTQARQSLTKYFTFYNERRVHETLGYATPDEVYFGALAEPLPAAA